MRFTLSQSHDRRSFRIYQVDRERSVFPAAFQTISSYNWSSSSTSGHHRIIVPGAPPTFVPPGAGRFAVPKETDNAIRSKYEVSPTSSPLEPLFHSVGICAPGFDMDTIDVVTDRYNLRQLLHFCGSPGERCLPISLTL